MRAEITEAARSVVNDTFTAIRAPLLSRRFQRAVAAMPAPVRVNVGAGNVRLDEWINTDVVWWSEMYLDLTRPWPVPPGSIDRIFGDNVIEHFPLDVARAVLRHCHDALRAGGAIRLATPDVNAPPVPTWRTPSSLPTTWTGIGGMASPPSIRSTCCESPTHTTVTIAATASTGPR